MLKTILIGLDGSPYSAAAVELGIRWARQYDCMLVGIGIIDEPEIRRVEPASRSGGERTSSAESHLKHARHEVERFLEEFAIRCSKSSISCKLLEDVGSPTDQILAEANRYDMIMLGKRTFFEFETIDHPDSTVYQVVRDSPRPVVVVPEHVRPGSSVVVAFDGSRESARALLAFSWTGLLSELPVHVLTVASERLDAARVADRAVEFLGFHGVQAHPVPHVARGDVPPALHEALEPLDPALVVMGAAGKAPIAEFLFGSVTQRMLKETRVPLFLFH